MTRSRKFLGVSAIALAVGFNAPYARLVSIFEYPGVLRQPAEIVLAKFAEGGADLILTWYAFGVAALALVPLSLALSLTPEQLGRTPARAIGAAILGSLAGVAQAIGLFRWTFVVPGIAARVADPEAGEAAREAALGSFIALNQFGGVAIGEHVGQLLTALFMLTLSSAQASAGSRATAFTGLAAAVAIGIGTGEGVAIAFGESGDMFSLATIAGYLGLSAWLIATGVSHLRRAAGRRAQT